uniref:Uncharacterized protein n=1 Tax=Romanomermis culicivorax TaxID=13658 RepID=A0A915K0V0_ROMCU
MHGNLHSHTTAVYDDDGLRKEKPKEKPASAVEAKFTLLAPNFKRYLFKQEQINTGWPIV